MTKVNFYIDDKMLRELERLAGTVSEHIRQALTRYMDSIQDVSTTKSVDVKKGGKNG